MSESERTRLLDTWIECRTVEAAHAFPPLANSAARVYAKSIHHRADRSIYWRDDRESHTVISRNQLFDNSDAVQPSSASIAFPSRCRERRPPPWHPRGRARTARRLRSECSGIASAFSPARCVYVTSNPSEAADGALRLAFHPRTALGGRIVRGDGGCRSRSFDWIPATEAMDPP
jgi:hypothetical protein